MVHNALLILHITAGFTALFGGLIAALSRKGNRTHLLSGRWFVWAMYVVAFSAIAMTIIKPNMFLMVIGLFSLYLTWSGRRAIFYFRLKEDYLPTMIDKAPVFAAFLVAIFMMARPLYIMWLNQAVGVSISFVFGAIMLSSTLRDMKTLRNPANFTARNKKWLLRHIGMISGAYIATLTAFLVTNIQFSPAWVIWLAPTAIGTIFITRNTNAWSAKLRINKAATIAILFTFSVVSSHAQQIIAGRVLDAENNPIAYANIGFVNSSVGTVSNSVGEFSLHIPEEINSDQLLRISVMGFSSVEYLRSQLKDIAELKILLQREDFQLPEVTVTSKNLETKTKGNHAEKSYMKTNLAIHSQPNMNLGASIGRRFNLGKKPTQIQKLHVFIAGNNFDTVMFRIQFYSLKNGKPDKVIHNEVILHELVNFRKGWVEIDLEAYNLVFNRDVAACVEWVDASQRGSALYLNMNLPTPGETHYYRFGAQNKWKVFHLMSTSMFLTLGLEK